MKFTLFPEYMRIHFSEVEFADYHYFWLRHNCLCNVPLVGCHHPKTGECILDSSEIPLSIKPECVDLQKNTSDTLLDKMLVIHWPKETELTRKQPHVTAYTLEWLREHAYALKRTSAVPTIPCDVVKIELDFKTYEQKYPSEKDTSNYALLNEEGMKKYREDVATILKTYGAVVVRGRGLDTENIIHDFLPSDRDVISSHFGRIEDLKTENTTNQNTDQLGYTNAGVDLHTDQPFIENPPGMQLLQCIQPAEKGGENYLVDAIAAAQYLKELDIHSYKMLCQTKIKFHRKQTKFKSLQVKPIIQEDSEGSIIQMRYSYFTMDPHMVPFEQMKAWYRSYNQFARIVRNQANQYRFLLKSGDYVLYDNHRMFHAREPFSGNRHMRGIYFDSKDLYEMCLPSLQGGH